MKAFISACTVLILIFLLILWSAAYCSETVSVTLAAIDDLESSPFRPETAEQIYSDFQKRADILKYFTVSSYIEEAELPLSALRFVPEDDTAAQKALIEELRLKLEKLRIAGVFSLETVV